MGMSPERVSVDRVTVSDLMTGTMNFKDDGTFDGEVVYPRMPDKNLRVSGTYTVHNGTLTIENQTNNSTTRSKLSFEQNFMIATPIDPKGVIAYYRRIE